jgi:hypothetical protein
LQMTRGGPNVKGVTYSKLTAVGIVSNMSTLGIY